MNTTATITAAAEITSTTAVHARMTPSRPDKIAAVTRVNYLECLLFDEDGHLRRHTSPERADELLWAINELRRQLGWLRLDMQHHHCCWPTTPDLANDPCLLPACTTGRRRPIRRENPCVMLVGLRGSRGVHS